LALLETEIQLSEILQLFGAKHPETRALQAQLQTIKQRLEVAVDSLPVVLQDELSMVNKYSEQLKNRYDEQLTKMRQVDALILQEDQVNQSLARLRDKHDATMEELRLAQLVQENQSDLPMGTSVKVIEVPSTVEQPLQASPQVITAIACGFGLLGGILCLPVFIRFRKN